VRAKEQEREREEEMEGEEGGEIRNQVTVSETVLKILNIIFEMFCHIWEGWRQVGYSDDVPKIARSRVEKGPSIIGVVSEYDLTMYGVY